MKEGYCEVCGRHSTNLQTVSIEGTVVHICPICLSKLGSRAVIVREEKPRKAEAPAKASKTVTKTVTRREGLEYYDIVDDYGERVRKAREARGWSEAVLAQRLKVSVDVIRKIEAGKYKPPISLARNLENILKIKLLVPTELEEFEADKPGSPTFGDVVVVRRGEE